MTHEYCEEKGTLSTTSEAKIDINILLHIANGNPEQKRYNHIRLRRLF